MKMLLRSLALAALVATSTAAGDAPSMVCEKTGVSVESCCCIQTEEALVCSLTGETVSACCCSPAR